MDVYKLNDDVKSGISKLAVPKDKIGDIKERVIIICDKEEVRMLRDVYRLPRNAVNDCLIDSEDVKIELYDGLVFGVIPEVIKDAEDSDWLTGRRLFFFMRENMIIIVKNESNRILGKLIGDLHYPEKGYSEFSKSIWGVLFVLIDRITKLDNSIVDSIESRMSDLEDRVLRGENKNFTSYIIDLRKTLIFLKREFEPMIDVTDGLIGNENKVIPSEGIKYFKLLKSRVERLNRNLFFQRDYVAQLREAYQSQVDISLNNTMKFFTVVTSIIFPLTLITGWFGMNFTVMGVLDSVVAYNAVIAVSVAIIVIGLVIFKRKRFI